MDLGKKGPEKENSSVSISNDRKCTYNVEQKENPNDSIIIIYTTELECFSNNTIYDLLYKSEVALCK